MNFIYESQEIENKYSIKYDMKIVKNFIYSFICNYPQICIADIVFTYEENTSIAGYIRYNIKKGQNDIRLTQVFLDILLSGKTVEAESIIFHELMHCKDDINLCNAFGKENYINDFNLSINSITHDKYCCGKKIWSEYYAYYSQNRKYNPKYKPIDISHLFISTYIDLLNKIAEIFKELANDSSYSINMLILSIQLRTIILEFSNVISLALAYINALNMKIDYPNDCLGVVNKIGIRLKDLFNSYPNWSSNKEIINIGNELFIFIESKHLCFSEYQNELYAENFQKNNLII